MPNVSYSDILDYLDAIAKANIDAANGNINRAPHRRFWLDAAGNRLTRDVFVSAMLPGVNCNAQPIPLTNADPAQCSFYQALIGANGWCNKGPMPEGGPFVTDANVMFTLPNQTQISGADVQTNIVWWLTHGMPN